MSEDMVFSVCYKGKFVTKDGITTYLGGEVHTLECPAHTLLTNLSSELDVTLYGQRAWYKLPFEELSDLKLLIDGSHNFKKMCEAAYWCKVIDIYMEADDVSDKEDGLYNVVIGEEGEQVVEEEADSSEEDEADSIEEDEANDRVEAEDDGETFEQDKRVEEYVSAFIDDEETYDYHDSPVNSDAENDKTEGRYEKYTQGSGELKLRQVLDSIPSVKKAVIEYVLKDKYNVRYSRWGETSEVGCKIKTDCPFRVYCYFEKMFGKFMIKTLVPQHSCTPDQHSSVLTEPIVANLFLNEVRREPCLKPNTIQRQMMQIYELNVSYEICRKAKRRALKMLQKEQDDQFSRLKDYKQELIRTNLDSTVELGTVTLEGGLEVFDRFYVCFDTLRRIWKAHCRPIFGIDGCFMKCDTKGQMLAAVGRDANNQMYPIAWAIVQVEDKDNWLWFMDKLGKDLNLEDGEGFTLISDRQKIRLGIFKSLWGLLAAVEHLLPKVEHRMCARHIYGNLKSKFPGKAQMKPLFWAVAESFNDADYRKALKEVEDYDIDVYKAMMEKHPQHCSRAFFKRTACCEDVHNNFSESYNNAVGKARSMPLMEMLETVRRQTMIRIDLRKDMSLKHKGKFSLKVAKVIKAEERHVKNCTLIAGLNGHYEVIENGIAHSVNLTTSSCVCRRFDITGIPC